MIVADHRILMPAGRIAHAAEAATPSCDQRRQHRLHAIAEREVGIPDDAGSHAGFAGIIGFTSLRQVGDCLDLPDGAQLGRSIGAILERQSMKTVATTFWPLPVSASTSSSMYRPRSRQT
jgi:hypothetical protein